MQLQKLHQKYDVLQKRFGHKKLCSIYGAGCIHNPRVMFVFMNPTGKNISANEGWTGIRAPWIGTKPVWMMFYELGLISLKHHKKIQEMRPKEWTKEFSHILYSDIRKNKVFITNLAKCTQVDARPLKDAVFKEYLNLLLEEIKLVNPKHIITFGNQVSSIILDKPISVSRYQKTENEILFHNEKQYLIYPTYYPVGQGRRNISQAIKRIKSIL